MDKRVQIELLVDHPEAIPILMEWFEEEWAPYYGPNGPGDAEQDLRSSCNRSELPIGLIALSEGSICGTAALKTESIATHPHLTPWLAALLVAPRSRRRGIVEQLISAVEEQASRLGFERIYVGAGEGSGTPESALRRRGWEFVEKNPYFISEASIYVKTL